MISKTEILETCRKKMLKAIKVIIDKPHYIAYRQICKGYLKALKKDTEGDLLLTEYEVIFCDFYEEYIKDPSNDPLIDLKILAELAREISNKADELMPPSWANLDEMGLSDREIEDKISSDEEFKELYQRVGNDVKLTEVELFKLLSDIPY